jgi:hypothetical protein
MAQGHQSSDETVSGGQGPSAAVRDGGVSYKSMVSAVHEVCQVVLRRHSQLCTNANYTESGNIIIDRICLAWYWLMLAIACWAASID